MQQEGDILSDKLFYIMRKIVQMLVKQFTCGKKLIKIAIPHYRQIGCDGINIFHPHNNVCPTCWHIHTLAFALQMFYANLNVTPQFE